MNKMSRLLSRQLKQHKLTEATPPTPDEWQAFLNTIERTYIQNEEDRYLQERSLSISSREMREALEREKKMSGELAHAAKLTSIGTLASGVAHELNNPLAGVKGYCEIMIGEKKNNLRR